MSNTRRSSQPLASLLLFVRCAWDERFVPRSTLLIPTQTRHPRTMFALARCFFGIRSPDSANDRIAGGRRRRLASAENVADAGSPRGVARAIEQSRRLIDGSSVVESREQRWPGSVKSKGCRGRSIAAEAFDRSGFMLVITGVINYVDRSTLSIAEQPIREELGLSKTEMGFLFRHSRGAMHLRNCPPAPWSTRSARGSCSPRGWPFGQSRRHAEDWSLACGSSSPRALRLASARRRSFRRARAWSATGTMYASAGLPTGHFNSSSSLGPALAPPLLTALMAAFGWRRMFFIMGALGLIAALMWYIFYRDPRQAGLSETDLQSFAPTSLLLPAISSLAQWLRLFRHPTTWGMVVGFAGALYLIWLYLTWLPGYLRIQHHMTTLQVGFAASVPFIFGFLGSLAGGAFSDRLAARGISPINSRKLPIAAGLLGMALFTVPAALTHDRNVAVASHCAGHVLRECRHGQCMGPGHGDGPVGLCRVAGLDPELRGILRRLVCARDHRQGRRFDRLVHAGSPLRSGCRRRARRSSISSWFASRSRPNFWTAKIPRGSESINPRSVAIGIRRVGTAHRSALASAGERCPPYRLASTVFAPPRTPPEPSHRSCRCPSRASGRCALPGRGSNTLCTRHSWAT